jgi:hypothetical protein
MARIPQFGIFLSGCKDTVCKNNLCYFFELVLIEEEVDWVD